MLRKKRGNYRTIQLINNKYALWVLEKISNEYNNIKSISVLVIIQKIKIRLN